MKPRGGRSARAERERQPSSRRTLSSRDSALESAAEGNPIQKHGKTWSGLCSQEWHLILLGLFCLGVVIFANTSGRPPPPSPEALRLSWCERKKPMYTSVLRLQQGNQGRYGYRPKGIAVKVLTKDD